MRSPCTSTKTTPSTSISLEELAEIYGERGSIVKWSELGVRNAACASDQIIRVGRQNSSGTYGYFRDVVLGRMREYQMGSIDQNGSKDVVALISRTPCALGYSGIAFVTAGVKALKLSTRKGEPSVTPSPDTVIDRSYPIARPLYLYTAKEPTGHVRRFSTGYSRARAARSSRISVLFRSRRPTGSQALTSVMHRGPNRRVSTLVETIVELAIKICGWSAIVFVFAIFVFVVREGAPALFGTLDLQEFLTSANWRPESSIRPQFGTVALIAGTASVTVLAMAIAVPLASVRRSSSRSSAVEEPAKR